MKRLLLGLCVGMMVLSVAEAVVPSNPILKETDPGFIYACDPSAEVFNGKVYVYCSHDQPDAVNYESMKDYAILESSDLETWINHGVCLDPQLDAGFEYFTSNMNAPDAAYKDGWYYWYFPGNVTEVGVAKSQSPTGPWEAAVTNAITTLFDPTVFVDDDGQAYIYGNDHWVDIGDEGSHILGAKLKDNMVELEGPLIRLSEEYVNEAVHVFKRNGIYYFSARVAGVTKYWMADTPLPQYAELQGTLAPNSPDSPNHTSVIEFNGEWYLFYHRGDVNSGSRFKRSACFDKMTFNADGTIQEVEYTLGDQGAEEDKPSNAALIAEWNFDDLTLVNTGLSAGKHDGLVVSGPQSDLVAGTAVFSANTPFGLGYALDLSSVADYLTIADSSIHSAGYTNTFDSVTNFTYSMWVMSPSGTWTEWAAFAGKGVENWGGDTADKVGWELRAKNFTDDGTQIDFWPSSTAQDSVPTDLTDGRWHHVAFTYDSTTQELDLYIDGSLAATAGGAALVPAPGNVLNFDAREGEEEARQPNCLYDNIQFYDGALAASEVTALYENRDPNSWLSREELGESPAAVNPLNLSVQGTTDWVMLGRDGVRSNRNEMAGADYIGEVIVAGTHGAWPDNAYLNSWTNGGVMPSATAVQGSWEGQGNDGSLSFSVTGLEPGLYSMSVYCSKYKANARFTASKGTESYSEVFDLDGTAGHSRYAVFTVDFSVDGVGDRVDVIYALTELGNSGNVGITAITLQQLPEPAVTDFSIDLVGGGTEAALRWNTTVGYRYILEATDHLTTGSWSRVAFDIPGNGGPVTITNTLTNDVMFFRAYLQE